MQGKWRLLEKVILISDLSDTIYRLRPEEFYLFLHTPSITASYWLYSNALPEVEKITIFTSQILESCKVSQNLSSYPTGLSPITRSLLLQHFTSTQVWGVTDSDLPCNARNILWDRRRWWVGCEKDSTDTIMPISHKPNWSIMGLLRSFFPYDSQLIAVKVMIHYSWTFTKLESLTGIWQKVK